MSKLSEQFTNTLSQLIEKGIIIDLIHSSPKTRKEIIDINKQTQNKRPLVFSHYDTAKIFNAHTELKHYNDYKLNPSNEEILAIKECDDIIGLIFYLYWLRGKEEENSIFGLLLDDNGIPYLIEMVRHIHYIS